MGIQYFRTALRFAYAIFFIVCVSLGVIMLVSSPQGRTDTALNSFSTELVAAFFILLPLAILAVVKAIKSYRGLNTPYGLPDTPVRSVLLAVSSFILIVAIFLILAIYFLVVHSPS